MVSHLVTVHWDPAAGVVESADCTCGQTWSGPIETCPDLPVTHAAIPAPRRPVDDTLWARILWAPDDPGLWHITPAGHLDESALCGFRRVTPSLTVESCEGATPIMVPGPLSRDGVCRGCLSIGASA